MFSDFCPKFTPLEYLKAIEPTLSLNGHLYQTNTSFKCSFRSWPLRFSVISLTLNQKNSLKWKLGSPTNTIHFVKTWLELIQLTNFQKSRILWHCSLLPALQKQKHTYWSVRVRRSRRHRLWFKLLVFKHQLLLCRANPSLYCNKLLKLGKPDEKK